MHRINLQAPASYLRRRFSVLLATSFAISIALHVAVLENPSWHQRTTASSTLNPLKTKRSLQVELNLSVRPTAATTAATETAMAEAPPNRTDRTDSKHENAGSDQTASETGTMSLPAPDPQTGFIPGPWYFPARLLHQRPQPTKSVEPEYPEAGRELEGLVVLTLLIGESGSVDDYRLDSAVPPGIFQRSAIEAFSSAHYTPGLINGKAVRSQLKVEIRYSPGEKPQTTFIEIPR